MAVVSWTDAEGQVSGTSCANINATHSITLRPDNEPEYPSYFTPEWFLPNNFQLKHNFSSSSKKYGYRLLADLFKGNEYISSYYSGYTDNVANNTYAVADYFYDYSEPVHSWSAYFNESNKTSRTVTLLLKAIGLEMRTSPGNEKTCWAPTNASDIPTKTLTTITATLDAPPVIGAPNSVTIDTAGYIYAGLSTASITATRLVAQYGGYITKAELSIGGLKDTKTWTEGSQPGSCTFTIPLDTPGTFTPTIVVTDSRGQTNTKELNPITVLPYECIASNLKTNRIDSTTFKSDDEGTNVALEATFKHTHSEYSSLTAPNVSIDGVATSNVTWYENWTASGGFSNPVGSGWSSLGPEVTLYAKLTDNFAKNTSYTISVKPNTTIFTNAAAVDTTLPQSFYLRVGREGGHGLGIGTKPPTDAFHVDMESIFYQDVQFEENIEVGQDILLDLDIDSAADATHDATSGADKDLFNAIRALGWYNDVIV